jgi:hypothetical protein
LSVLDFLQAFLSACLTIDVSIRLVICIQDRVPLPCRIFDTAMTDSRSIIVG